MDPYKTPEAPQSQDLRASLRPIPLPNRGRPCSDCGSANTGTNTSLAPRPGVISIILFGWIAILIRTAFGKKTEACRDCGATHHYRTPANRIALVLLLIMVLLLALAYFEF